MEIAKAMSAALPITKSDFLLYLACPPEFWYAKHRPELFTAPPSEEALFNMHQGMAVERLARGWFQGMPGHDAAFQVVYETENLYARADVVLTHRETCARMLVEIKSSAEVKGEHLYDLAFQVLAAEAYNVAFDQVAVLHVNSAYVRRGETDIQQLLVLTDVTEQVFALVPDTRTAVGQALNYLEQAEPRVALHEGCDQKLDCPVIRWQHPGLPDYTVYHIAHLKAARARVLLSQGIVDVRHVTEAHQLSDRQRLQVRVAQTGEPHIDTQSISKALQNLRFPLYFLDYETLGYAIPLYEGVRPYQQMPFQWSLHVVPAPGAEAEHHAFLSDGSGHPARDFVEKLRRVIPTEGGTVVVWNQSFEKDCNKKLAAMYPEHASFLNRINDRVYDLMEIFQKQHYVHPHFKGRYSIKTVLPVLVPHLSYEGLPISNGSQAYINWHRMVTGDMPEVEKRRIMDDLLVYCRLDTLAMVEVWRVVVGEGR